jgi:hypothetical protein
VSALLLALLALPAFADAPPTDWDRQWKDCHDVTNPKFKSQLAAVKEFTRQGNDWDTAVASELVKIDLVTKETCKRWAADPNGDGPLREFVEKYTAVTKSALELEGKSQDYFLPSIQKWWALESAEVGAQGLDFRQFPCGRAFDRTRKHVDSQTHALQERFRILKTQCPKAADAVIEKTRAAVVKLPRTGAPSASPRLPASRSPATQSSDITGTERALEQDRH